MRKRSLISCLLISALAASALADISFPVPVAHGNSAQWEGDYKITIAGDYSAKNTAHVRTNNGNTKIRLMFDVVLPDGTITSANFRLSLLDGNYFKETVRIAGVDVEFSGRFDRPAPGSPGARIAANLRDTNGKGGRLIGIKTN